MGIVMLQPVVSTTFSDETLSVGTMRTTVVRGLSAVAGLSAAADFRSTVAPMTSCAITSSEYVLVLKETRPAKASAGARVWRGGLFIFETAVIDKYLIVSVPGLNPAYVMTTGPGAGNDIDLTIQPVIDFIEAIISGPWCNPFGHSPTVLAIAVYQIRAF